MLEEDKEFDLKIRSILEDGREEVPDHLWEAVQKRLPAKKNRPVVIWLRRSAMAAAAAAAAAAFIFLGADIFISTRNHAGQTMDMAADAGIQVVSKTSAAEDSLPSDGMVLAEAQQARDDGYVTAASSAHPEEIPQQSESMISEAVPQSVTQGTMQQTYIESAADLSGKPEESENAVSSEVREVQGETASTGEAGDIDKSYGKDDKTSAITRIDDSQILDADIDAIKRRTHVAMTVSGNAISNSTQGKSARSIAPMQSSGIPPANSLHEDMATSYGIPLSFGAGVKIFFNRRWALGAGINYSLLNRTLSGIYYDENSTPFSDSDILNSQSYIGIPVNVYFSILKKDFIDLYAYAGGTVEKCVSSTYLIDAPGQPLTYRERSHGVQLSADLGIGVEFLVIDRLGIYIDPSVRYYFKSSQPKSIRTVQPLMIGFEAGLRVRL